MSRHIVDIEAEASEASRDMDIPAGSKPTRPGRTTVLSVRLGQDEADALTELAATRSVPVSTLARSLIVEALQTGDQQPETVHDEVVRALRETLRSDFLAAS
ncbi:hypothetical protein CLV30_101100 [Haloactinopolyspora alba]|uniref:Uncharacterized protein n=1 Tax=Haloactinopolyspora alba TaxID=648780 RepID=A0A2P8EF90_9ACTN|nr:hypothetical protein [Haloactinopolyspora alba]PSL08133.1 hypothetical protein CLV30_101100 [Haloactinopolyspora alba]